RSWAGGLGSYPGYRGRRPDTKDAPKIVRGRGSAPCLEAGLGVRRGVRAGRVLEAVGAAKGVGEPVVGELEPLGEDAVLLGQAGRAGRVGPLALGGKPCDERVALAGAGDGRLEVARVEGVEEALAAG